LPDIENKWAALFLRTALWMREAPSEFDLCWRELVIVAMALADGRDMSEIGLMHEIAQQTVAVLTDGRLIFRKPAQADKALWRGGSEA
jgi:hypothetical protein